MKAQQPSLQKATIGAFLLAVIMLVTVILPAEYNIDPTGIGRTFGLTVFSAPEDTNTLAAPAKDGQETIEITVPAGKGVEYKCIMPQ